MGERERGGVEELAFETELAGDPVDRIARDPEVDRLQMDADLVRSSGLQRDREQRVGRERLGDLEQRDGVAGCRRVERMARAILAVAADRRLDPPGSRARARP